jgi:hypothetical protein
MASKGTATALVKLHTNHAFNYQLWGYDAETDERVENQVIRLNSIVAKNRYKAVQEASTADNGPPLVPTEEELRFDMDDETLLTAVIVGMRPSCSPIQGYGDARLLKISGKRASVQPLKRDEILEYDPTALRVVCLCFRKDAVYYALTSRDEDTNLCDAVIISGEEVFFFSEFRNDTDTSYHARKMSWTKKIRAML